MSFYEWTLHVERYNSKADLYKLEMELKWDHTRRLMAMIGNVFRGKDQPALQPQDVIKLSWDKIEQEIRDPKEIFEALKKRFGSKIKKKNVE